MTDEKDFASLKALAASGDAAAQGRLGREYLLGSERCDKDEAEAVRWLAPAAARGDPVGCWGMAACLLMGLGGVSRDMEAALSLCEKSIAAGCADGFRLRGFQYGNGIGVAKDMAEACRWYKMAADRGDAAAQVNLGLMYAEGQGVPRSRAEAYRLFRAAADSGSASARRVLGDMFWDGTGIDKDETEAVRLYRLAAGQRDRMAQYCLGYACETGKGTERDLAQARRWYREAAENGLALAQYILGEFYEKGTGGAQDDKEAARWYEAAARQGHADAQVALGLMRFRGKGGARDEGQARQWFQAAAEQGEADGARYLKELDDGEFPDPAGRGKPALGLRPAADLLLGTAGQYNREAYQIFLKLAEEYGQTCAIDAEEGEMIWCTGLLTIQARLATAACGAHAGRLEKEFKSLLGGAGAGKAGPVDLESFAASLEQWDETEKMLRDVPEGNGDPAGWTMMRIVYAQVYGNGRLDTDRLMDINGFSLRVWNAVYPYFFIWNWIRNDFELDFSGSEAPYDNLRPGTIVTLRFDPAAWKPTREYGAVFRVLPDKILELLCDTREEEGHGADV